jgi:hypothetical protein
MTATRDGDVQVSFTFNAEGATLKGTVAGQGDFMV